ncbi:MBL fold metallo-hydrolase [Haloplasma contractile]|uniref:VicX protein n=1 Tax=Haloplasma contractile SSD-17B TaxID=1033810 RepID=F7PT61_9MOLU|nr:MBL fold metallo-hydrolase [Haloplasma contractile]ERJ12524.1 VicX protein [Haloplasma contractile SSD-17B]
MKITVLASGSKGNAAVVETEHTKILIDIGLSYKQLKIKLKEKNIEVEELDALLITHEHADHTKGMATFSKRHQIPVYTTKGTHEAIDSSRTIFMHHENKQILNYYDKTEINDVSIQSIPISHDASEPTGFIIKNYDKKVVYITDTGYVSEEVESRIKNADAYILECNHDVELLMMTNRPWHLKQRILSDEGHICNEDTFYVLERIRGENTKLIFLAHISDEANNRDLLKMMKDDFINRCDLSENDISIVITEQHKATEIYEI